MKQLVKISIAVWLPVITLVAIYSAVYVVKYHQARNYQAKYSSYILNCATKSQKTGTHFCDTWQSESIKHGFLWFPYWDGTKI